MNMKLDEIEAEARKEFYQKCTNGIDEENDYYDADYDGHRPYEAEAILMKYITKAYLEGVNAVVDYTTSK